jgi:hypothetical protein
MALFFPYAYQAIDWDVPISFRSTKLQPIAPDQQSGKQRADTLVMVRSRVITSTPGCVLSHCSTTWAERSGWRSTGR